jgi:hypothetical protein
MILRIPAGAEEKRESRFLFRTALKGCSRREVEKEWQEVPESFL